MKINNIINSNFIKLCLILLLILFTKNLYSNNLQLKIIGNKNLDEEFIKSIVDLDQDLENDELVNFIIKELFSTGYFIYGETNSALLCLLITVSSSFLLFKYAKKLIS